MSAPLIVLRDATVDFGGGAPPALDRVNLAVARGSWTAVVGANGSGKTTLLAVLGGAVAPRPGARECAPGVRAALLLQEPDNQFVATRVAQELALSVPLEIDAAQRRARLDAAVERFELGALLERNPHRLSGGEKQRLALATVWLEAPDVLLLDEPLAYLDAPTRERVVGFARELNGRGVAIVWTTPGGGDVALARDAVVLERGRVVFAGPAGGLQAPEDATVLSRSGPRAHAPFVARCGFASEHPSRLPARLIMEKVSFAYDGAPVLRELDLDVHAGECVGITGDNSAGKSTLLLVAGGALAPAPGRVTREAGDGGVLYLPQSPERLFFAETVFEEIGFGLERRGLARAAAREAAAEALAAVALDPAVFGERSPFQLSLGEMRRVAFAVAASLKPGLLLLDEPASCLDRGGIEALDSLIRARADEGGAVVVVSHDRAHLARVAGRVLSIRGGRLE